MDVLFTIICEYKGGTYTKQVRAGNATDAFLHWAELFRQEAVLTPKEKKHFADEVAYSLKENNLVTLENLQNVWYEGFSLEDDLLEVILVGTASQPIPSAKETLQPTASAKHEI